MDFIIINILGFIEERLDRVMRQIHGFSLFLDTRQHQRRLCHKKFRFENKWLNESNCGDIIKTSWVAATGQPIEKKIEACGQALSVWGGSVNRNFRKSIVAIKQKLLNLGGKKDALRWCLFFYLILKLNSFQY